MRHTFGNPHSKSPRAKFRQSRLAVVEGFEKGSTTAAAWIYMSQIHAHRFGLGYSIGSAGPNNAKVQNLYNQG